jgi:hypothetical protein
MRPSLLSIPVAAFFACGGGGTIVGGWTQTATQPGTNMHSVTLAIDGAAILVGGDQGVWKSIDEGATWTQASTGLPTVTTVEALFAAAGKLFAGTDDGTFVSVDHAATWTKSDTGLPTDVSPYAFWAPGNALLVGMNAGSATSGGLFRSTDQGATWNPVSGWPTSLGAVSFTQIGGTVFTAFGMSVGRSTDLGGSWVMAPSPGPSNVLWLEAASGMLFAATANAGVWSSTDGINWTAANGALPSGEIVSTLYIYSDKLYAGTATKGAFITSDRGGTWTAYSGGFSTPPPRVIQFAVHGMSLFAITESNGLWKRAF